MNTNILRNLHETQSINEAEIIDDEIKNCKKFNFPQK